MRQYHETMSGERVPVNPDCGIRNCTRAEYRAGLCRKHYEYRPSGDGYRSAIENMRRFHEAGIAYRAAVVAQVQAIVDAEP